MASDNRVNVNNQGKNVNTIGISNDAEMETSLKREKARTKSNFTRSRNKMLFLIENMNYPTAGRSRMRVADWTMPWTALWTR